jgi:hypothetical protein
MTLQLALKKAKTLFLNPRFVLGVWLFLAVMSGIKQYSRDHYNNYRIFKNVFWNTLDQKNLYLQYPELHSDSNHYGPFFSVVIAPFAVMPDFLGIILWNMLNGALLFYAIRQLPFRESQFVALLWLVTNELFTSYVNIQFNPIIAATIILAYVWMRQEKDFWAAFIIVAGTFVKLYSIVGLAFFFFSKNKGKFVASGAFWFIICLLAPMLFSSPSFIIQSYIDWYDSLVFKNQLNVNSLYQDVSLMGVFRRTTDLPNLPTLYFIVPGVLLFLVPYTKFRHFSDEAFQLMILCSVMLFVCLFSTGTESSTYIIAFTGVCIWFFMHERPYNKTVLGLMIFAFVVTSMSPTVFTGFIKDFAFRYSLKALPCILVWFYLMADLIRFEGSASLPKIQLN